MAAGDLILTNVTLTADDLSKLLTQVINGLNQNAKDPSQYDLVTSLEGISSLPVFHVSGSTYNLVRVALSVLKGVNGKEVELQENTDKTYIQWRYTDGTWNNLIAIANLKGASGEKAMLKTGSTGIEWKYESEADTAYRVLVAYDVLKLKYTDLTDAQKAELKAKTPVLSVGTVQNGTTAAATIAENGTDTNGNPVYQIDLTLPAGETGKTPQISIGTITTGNAGSSASGSVVADGVDASGNPIYKLSLTIPRGEQGLPGTGSGNVSVSSTGLVTTKQYLFVPSSDGSTAGAFVEYTLPGVVTTTANGLMSSTDKSKLNGIATGANNYTHPAYTPKSSGLYKITVDGTGHVSAAVSITKEDITNLGIPAQDTTYSNASSTVAGLMSATDKTLFDFYTGSNSVTTLASLPVTKNLVIATLSAATTISLASDLSVNQSIHICATATAAFIQPVPNSGEFVSMSGSSVSIASGAHFEIDILCTAASTYQIMVSIQS